MKLIFSLLLTIALFGCNPKQEFDPVKRYGLVQTDNLIDIAKKSIHDANSLLNSDEVYLYEGKLRKQGTALIWVGPENLSASISDMMFVLRDCSCIVAQVEVFQKWAANYELISGLSDESILSGTDVMTYFLLHEVGHIRNGHAGRALGSGDSSNFNREDTSTKQNESAADSFAASIIAEGKDGDLELSLLANSIQLKLAMLSFDLQGIRVTQNFGCSATDSPCAFHDKGDTHPNLEYRFLRVNCLLDEQYCPMLEDYEKRRNSDGIFDSGLLFKSN